MHKGKNGDLEGVAALRDLKLNGRGVWGDFPAAAVTSGIYLVVGMEDINAIVLPVSVVNLYQGNSKLVLRKT